MRSLGSVALFTLPVIAAACSSKGSDDGGGGTGGNNGTVQLHQGTSFLPASASDVANVQSDRIVFAASAGNQVSSLEPGNIIMGDRQSAGSPGKNPAGFLRKVKSVSQGPDGTTVLTDPVTLPEAVDSLQFQATLQVPPLGRSGPLAAAPDPVVGGGSTGNGSTPQRARVRVLDQGSPISLIDYSNTTLLDYDGEASLPNGKKIGFHATATLPTATLNFTPSYDVGVQLGFLKVSEAHVIATGQLDANLQVDAKVDLESDLDSTSFTQLIAQQIPGSKGTTIADYEFSLGSIKAGPISVPVNAHFTANLACTFAWGGGVEVSAGATASASLTAGVSYQDGNFTPKFDHSDSFNPTGPDFKANGAIRASCSVTPKFELSFFGVASADISAEAHVGVGGGVSCDNSSDPPQGQVDGDLEAGASAKVHGKVDLLGLHWDKECTLFNENSSNPWQGTFPLPSGSTCTTTDGYKLPAQQDAHPELCFGDGDSDGGGSGGGIIQGTCTHDVCTAGDKLGQQCDDCTMKVCAADSYCCDTYWGASCFDDVQKYCGKTCQ